MRKHLWLIDLTLLGLVFLVGTMVRDRWLDSQSREQALLRQMVRVAPAPVIPAMPGVNPSMPASYMEVAQQFLFSRDRNPNVILDPPPPPPPPVPMPALPLSYGVLDLGAGPTIILVDKPGGQHRGYHVGEMVGPFKLVALSDQVVTFDWEGKQVTKKVDELIDKRAKEAQVPAPAQAAAAKPQANAIIPVKAGPGVELGEKSRACVPGDTTPAGTITDGFKKVTNKTPFGESCRWEAVN